LNSLNKLNKIIESINFNITDDNINDFHNEILELEPQYANNKTIIYFFKMLQALAKYLDSKRENIQSDTIPTLKTIVCDLEKLMDNPEFTEDENRKILSNSIHKFRSLKNKITSKPVISDNDINELQAVILAIDWEISDTTLANFEKVITNQLSRLKYYKIHYAFLKIIHSIARYIGAQKANAHTDSISFLHSVFKNFEQIVQTSDMNYQKKKSILETDIEKFQAFKKKISLKSKNVIKANKKPADQPANKPADISDNTTSDTSNNATFDTTDDEPMTPALSQFRQTDLTDEDDDASLTTLLTTDNNSLPAPRAADSDTVETGEANSENIMDDLFNAKESPADELLDAIHLLNVHGDNPEQAIDMLDQSENDQPDSIKNYTPQTKTNDPIPEIENRLNEFFNLDTPDDSAAIDDDIIKSEKQNVQMQDMDQVQNKDQLQSKDQVQHQDHDNGQPIEICESDKAEKTDGIVPFDDQDESFEEIAKQYDGTLKTIMLLKTIFDDDRWLKDESSISSINQNIANLKEQWQNDPEKTALMQIITMNIDLLKSQNNVVEPDNITDNNFEEEPGLKADKKGIWNKIKNKFN
jgi:hypothetical protein